MRLPRLTTRRLMVVVVVVALALATGIELGRRRAEYLRLAVYHTELSRGAGSVFRGGVVMRPDPRTHKVVRTTREKCQHHYRVAEKYLRAARYPWLPVPPDPPEPK